MAENQFEPQPWLSGNAPDRDGAPTYEQQMAALETFQKAMGASTDAMSILANAIVEGYTGEIGDLNVPGHVALRYWADRLGQPMLREVSQTIQMLQGQAKSPKILAEALEKLSLHKYLEKIELRGGSS